MTGGRLGLGFVGLGQAVGLILRRREEIAGLPVRVAAAAEVPERAEALRAFEREFGGRGYTSVEQLCADSGVDVVYVATLPELHLEHVSIAAEHGKHVIVEKPMALDVETGRKMIEVADAAGIRLMAGHTHSFDAPVRAMHELIDSGNLGDLLSILTFNYNDFNPRPWPTRELAATRGPLLNQGPHQVDIVRQLGGGVVKSVRASMFWDELRSCEAGYNCHLTFESGVSALLSFDARGLFDSAELFGWVGEGGQDRDPGTATRMRKSFREMAAAASHPADLEARLEATKELGRYGVQGVSEDALKAFGYSRTATPHQPFFGYTLASCSRGTIRQSKAGLVVYDDEGPREIQLDRALKGRAAELSEMYDAIVHDRPLVHDGRWGLATLEVCLAIGSSADEGREIVMEHQVPTVPTG